VAVQLLGRGGELAALQEQLRQTVTTGQCRIVLVRGEPGIGKSSLLKTFLASVPGEAGGRPVLVGYGQSMTNSLGSDAFGSIRECPRSLVVHAEQSSSRDTLARVAHALREHAPDWLESVPMVGSLLSAGMKTGITIAHSGHATAPDLATSSQLTSRLDQLTALVSDLFASGPLVLVLDDLHWADSATIDIVMALALKATGPLLLVLSYNVDPSAVHTALRTRGVRLRDTHGRPQ
jgi:hypothetical protein